MKLSSETLLGLQAGMNALDGTYTKIIEESKSAKKAVQVPFNLKPNVRIENGIRLARIDEALKGYQKLRNELVEKYGEAVDDEFKVSAKNMMTFQREDRKNLEAKIEINLPELDFSDLNMSDPVKNPIPGSVLALLDPIRKGRDVVKDTEVPEVDDDAGDAAEG